MVRHLVKVANPLFEVLIYSVVQWIVPKIATQGKDFCLGGYWLD